MRDHVLLSINGVRHEVRGRDAFLTLSSYLRYEKGATGTKIVCEEGDCGACSVLLGKQVVNSCIQFMFQLDGASITTVEGVGTSVAMSPIQESMVRNQGAQCGFCTPGFVVALTGLAAEKASFNERDVRDALTGNLCRCTGYEPILNAALEVAGREVHVGASSVDDGQSVRVEHDGRIAFIPTTLEEAIDFKAAHPETVVIQGATDLGVLSNKRGARPNAFLGLAKLRGLDELQAANGTVVVGARVSLSRLEAFVRDRIPEFHRILTLFGSPQIRNAGTLAGNIGNGSPIADTLPFLFVTESEIEVAGKNGTRRINLNQLYKGYKKLDLSPDEIITRILIPIPRPDETLKLYKVSKRKDLDISTFTAAIRLRANGKGIESPRIAYGGVAATVVRLPRTEAYLDGKPFELETFERAGEIARSEIKPISDVRGSSEYRSQLAQNILLKFYYETAEQR